MLWDVPRPGLKAPARKGSRGHDATASMSASSAVSLKREMAWEILLSFGSMQLRAQGYSMFPTLRRGDVLNVERVEPQQVRVGDVVVMARGSGFVSHRVVSTGKDVEGGLLVTRGDATAVDDLPWRESDLLGRVRHVIRNGNRIAVPSHLNAIRALVARLFCRSFPVIRAVIEVRGRLRNGFRTPNQSIAQCQS